MISNTGVKRFSIAVRFLIFFAYFVLTGKHLWISIHLPGNRTSCYSLRCRINFRDSGIKSTSLLNLLDLFRVVFLRLLRQPEVGRRQALKLVEALALRKLHAHAG